MTTAAFWLLLGITFAFGAVLPYRVTGVIVLAIGGADPGEGCQDRAPSTRAPPKSGRRRRTARELAVRPGPRPGRDRGPHLDVGPVRRRVGHGEPSASRRSWRCVIAWVLTRAPAPASSSAQSDRMIQQVGPVGMLPQFLAMLGVVFTEAGVGEVVANAIAKIVPEGNQLAGVIAYCVGMALFTVIVGNTFAAFTVITAGIGVPFVIALGRRPRHRRCASP